MMIQDHFTSALRDALFNLASAAARIVEDDDKPTLVHMRELNRRRCIAANLLSAIEQAEKSGKIPHGEIDLEYPVNLSAPELI